MIHRIEQSGLGFEFLLKVFKFRPHNISHPNVHMAVAIRHIVIGSQNADHTPAIFADNICHRLDGPRFVLHLETKLNTADANPLSYPFTIGSVDHPGSEGPRIWPIYEHKACQLIKELSLLIVTAGYISVVKIGPGFD